MLSKLKNLVCFEKITEIPEKYSGICTVTYNNSIFWIKNGKIHRENDLPAVISFDGDGQTKQYQWVCDGERHRLYAPAVATLLRSNDLSHLPTHQYWYKGEYFVEEQFWKLPEMQKHKLNSLVKL